MPYLASSALRAVRRGARGQRPGASLPIMDGANAQFLSLVIAPHPRPEAAPRLIICVNAAGIEARPFGSRCTWRSPTTARPSATFP